MKQNNPVIFSEELEIASRLSQFGITRQELIEVVHAATVARNDTVENLDPANGGGLLSWIYGTRFLRSLLLSKGWEVDRKENVESVVNHKLGLKFIFQNTDTACRVHETPKAISGKGSASRRQVAEGIEQLLLPLPDIAVNEKPNLVVWFLCVAIENHAPVAELLCPKAIEDKQFNGCLERIFILPPGGDQLIDRGDDADDSGHSDVQVTVTRKK